MRANRISQILFASFLASAATLAAAPASAQSPYDGLWQVTVVTKTGSCDAQTTSTVTLDDGSSERIRCRSTYKVNGPTMEMVLTCASDAYRFNLQAAVVAAGGEVSGTWSESSRNVGGNIQGRGANGSFQVIAQAAGFGASIALKTTGNKQHIAMKADSQFRAANISLSK